MRYMYDDAQTVQMSLDDDSSDDRGGTHENVYHPITFSYPRASGYFPHSKDKPIISYGVIVFTRTSDGVLKFLVYQRRETFSYMEFMKGVWRTKDDLIELFKHLTPDERSRIRNYTFDELWNDLWVIQNFRFFKEGFSRSKNKYMSVLDIIPEILDTTESDMPDLPWGFPKGKKDKHTEGTMECAFREFREETGVNPINFVIHHPNVTYNETFRGGNGKLYSTKYYLAESPVENIPTYYPTPQCIRKRTVSSEALDFKWMTLEELSPLLTKHRRNILKAIQRSYGK